jgi:Chaperone of endosialidase
VALYSLKPVAFRYKPEFDKSGTPQFGLIAEEVAAVNPNLVVRDAKGEISTVRNEAINVMLLNEFLKEHQKVEKLEATVADLATQLREVRAQVQLIIPLPELLQIVSE